MVATLPDLLRLFAVPFFAYVAWRDVETRRVPNQTWYPLGALALVLLAWDGFRIFSGDVSGFQRQLFAIQVVVSLGIVAPLAYVFWRIGGFGGADAKAFFVVAVLFPAYPTYTLAEANLVLPLVVTDVQVFSLTILSNTVLVGLAYPLLLAARNAAGGHLSPGMFVAKPIRPGDAIEEYGSMLTFADRGLTDDLSLSGLREYFSWRGLDLDALRMYLQWRGVTLAAIRENPEQYRDPASLPAEPNPPGDGAIATDGGTDAAGDEPVDDPWGAEAFLDDIESNAYGTTPETLREGLDSLVAEDVIWISPGIPFLVPLFGGLVVALTYGDILFGILGALGLV